MTEPEMNDRGHSFGHSFTVCHCVKVNHAFLSSECERKKKQNTKNKYDYFFALAVLCVYVLCVYIN